MKNITQFKSSILQVTLIAATLFSLLSCTNQKIENTQDVAEESNKAKFDSTTKEKDAKFLVKAASRRRY